MSAKRKAVIRCGDLSDWLVAEFILGNGFVSS